MKYTNHLICGFLVGGLQYLVRTTFSYLLLLQKASILLAVVFCVLIAFLAGWNIFYRVNSCWVMILRIFASLGGNFLALLVCADLGVIVALENRVGLSSGSQNAQGLISVLLLGWRLLAGITVLIIKVCSIRNNEDA